MAAIPLHTKVSLINNYIQTNYLKSRGKAEHESWPISEVLEAIKEDLNALEKDRNTEQIPLGLIVRDLKSFRNKQASLQVSIDSVIEKLNSLKESQSDPEGSLDKVIKDIEEMDKE